MNERIYIYDRSGGFVNDPEKSVDYASTLRWDSMWPKGFGPASFTVARDIAAQWAAKMAYGLIVRDGQKIVYQGRLGGLGRLLRQGGEQIQVPAVGWYASLAERQIRKRWIDEAPIGRLEWPVSGDEQESFPTEKRDDFLQVRLAAVAVVRAGTEIYRELYTAPQGTTVRRVTLDWKRRTGEGMIIQLYNIDTSSSEWSVSGTDATGSADQVFADAANQFEIRMGPTVNDTYDHNDYGHVDNVVVYCTLDDFGSPTYDGEELIEDILSLVGDDISVDYDLIGDPALVLAPFITDGDDYESADSIAQRIAAYGDASQNTWGLSVWDEAGTSDSKPKATFEARDVSDHDYAVSLADLAGFSDAESDDDLINYVAVKYTDDKGITRYRTPTDNASLTDADSITAYGQREHLLDVGQADVTRADYVGERYLEYHKDPLRKSSFSAIGYVKSKEGLLVPANRVRAGQRVKILDYEGGTVYFLRSTSYDAETALLTMTPDIPPDDLAVFLAQEKAGLV